MAKAHVELVKFRSDKEDLIDNLMDSQKFKDLMEVHDEGLYPAQFSERWNQAVVAILEKHPGVFDPKIFVSPFQPIIDKESEGTLGSPMQEDDILDPENFPLHSPARASKILPRLSKKEMKGMAMKMEMAPRKSNYFSPAWLLFVYDFVLTCTS